MVSSAYTAATNQAAGRQRRDGSSPAGNSRSTNAKAPAGTIQIQFTSHSAARAPGIGPGRAAISPYHPYPLLKKPSPSSRPAARMIQPILFAGRRDASTKPTTGTATNVSSSKTSGKFQRPAVATCRPRYASGSPPNSSAIDSAATPPVAQRRARGVIRASSAIRSACVLAARPAAPHVSCSVARLAVRRQGGHPHRATRASMPARAAPRPQALGRRGAMHSSFDPDGAGADLSEAIAVPGNGQLHQPGRAAGLPLGVLELENGDLEAAQVYLQEAVAIADALALPRFRWGVRTNPRRSPSSVSTAQIGRRSESNPDRQVWIVTPPRAGAAAVPQPARPGRPGRRRAASAAGR